MNIFFLFLITFSNAKGFPSEPEENDDIYDLLSPENSTLDIKSEHEDSVNVDKIQGELREQKTVVNKMISNIQAEMTAMKACLLRNEENIAESISVCTAALEYSIQKAVIWATPQEEEDTGISDQEIESEPVDIEDMGPPRILSVNATGVARVWSWCMGNYSLTKEQHNNRPVYRNSQRHHLYILDSGVWAVDGWVGNSQPLYRSTDQAPSPALCQSWEYKYLDRDDGWKYKPGDITVVDISDPGESQEGHFIMTALLFVFDPD